MTMSYTIIRELGSGYHAKVYLVKMKDDGQLYAMKRCRVTKSNRNCIETEALILKEVSLDPHPNILYLKHQSFDEQLNCHQFFLTYANQGELFHYVKNNTLTEKQVYWLFQQLMQGLLYLKEKKIWHNDLKPENLFLHQPDLGRGQKFVVNRTTVLLIGDFSMSLHEKSDLLYFNASCGSIHYSAPEIMFGPLRKFRAKSKKDGSSDIWSLGVILYVMITNSLPCISNEKEAYRLLRSRKIQDELQLWRTYCPGFDIDKKLDCKAQVAEYLKQYNLIDDNFYSHFEIPSHIQCSLELRDLVTRLLQPQVSQRMTLNQIMDHPWLKMFEPLTIQQIIQHPDFQPQNSNPNRRNSMISIQNISSMTKRRFSC